MHEYTVEFRICGKDLDTSLVSADLGIEPSLVVQAGDSRGKTTQFEEALWAYDGYPEAQAVERRESLEDGLAFLLDKLWPVKDKIDNYKSRYELVLWCGHFQSSFDGGPTLSPTILKSLGEFGVELFIDNYFGVDDDKEEAQEDYQSQQTRT